MPIVNRIADFHDEITQVRRDLHQQPELMFDVHKTAQRVVDELKSYGIQDITTGVGRSGVVAVIEGKSNTSGKTVGLRADMDALPLQETSASPTLRRSTASCMPVATTVIPPCCWLQRNICRKPGISTARSF